MSSSIARAVGSTWLGEDRTRFVVWAPQVSELALHLVSPAERLLPMARVAQGYYETSAEGVRPGCRYFYRLDRTADRPDPASRFQPEGVHGPSEVLDPRFPWEDHGWFGLPLSRYVIYELHVGTFTAGGTFDAVIPRLDALADLGVTAIELMPVAQFPGERNWGYDGVYPFAVQNSYGGPQGLKRLVNECHRRGLAVVLDVVYNHLGPEGNYTADFGPYSTARYHTPWGRAMNFDGPDSDHVRSFFIQNALYWTGEFHIDALRLDAVHAILDHSPRPFLEELAGAIKEQAERLNRRIYLIPESAANDARLIRARELGGYGLDAQWSDDFHHALHVLLTGERTGYYQDYGELRHLVKAYREGFAYAGEYSAFRRRRHGSSARDLPAERFVVCAQNHDQIGNRMMGERLTRLVSYEALKLAAAAVILSPFIPLLFMGEEHAETAPFQYFISHGDPQLVEAVRRGRRDEFAHDGRAADMPDPQDEATFYRCKINHRLRAEGRHRAMFEFYKELLRLRRELPALSKLSKENLECGAFERERVVWLRRWSAADDAYLLLNFNAAPSGVKLFLAAGAWRKELDSGETRWEGPGSALPGVLTGGGEIEISVPAHTAILLYRPSGNC
ncbi:MAG TPA: malto-oligosyltrehalose trehalohydrolase [Candidatus Acidoferrales bacterium]|nr:malto-oligosyltrehalose trehalohydrolase [Candidatus Acidoferrales bacterium]